MERWAGTQKKLMEPRSISDFMSSGVSARKLSTFWVSGEPEEGRGVGERHHREGTKIVLGCDTHLNNSGFRTPTEEMIYLQVEEAPNTEVCTLSTHEPGEQRASMSCRLPLLQAVWTSLTRERGRRGWLAGPLWNDGATAEEPTMEGG